MGLHVLCGAVGSDAEIVKIPANAVKDLDNSCEAAYKVVVEFLIFCLFRRSFRHH